MEIHPNYPEEKDDIASGTEQGEEQDHISVKPTRAFVFIINYRDRNPGKGLPVWKCGNCRQVFGNSTEDTSVPAL